MITTVIPHGQRALVFQGGGALGAYEAGAYKEISAKIQKEYSVNTQNTAATATINEFDIVIGTSIGAINASVLVGHYLKNNNSWEGSADKLLEFWKGLSDPTFTEFLTKHNPFFDRFWTFWNTVNPNIANAELARKFWSVFEFAFTPMGVSNLYTPVPHWGSKFLNPFSDFLPWWRYDFTRLRNYLTKFIDFPIKTSFEENQPRLTLVSVDVQDFSTPVIFDSYAKLHEPRHPLDSKTNSEDNHLALQEKKEVVDMWFSEYGPITNRHFVFYDGIGVDQVLASALGKYSLNHPTLEDRNTGTIRQFWDGGYHSNTPFRQLVMEHRKYWNERLKKLESKEKLEIKNAPDLEVYVINLHASIMKSIPTDKDLIDERESDMIFHDRTRHDEEVAYLVTDYVNLCKKFINVAKTKGFVQDAEAILEEMAPSSTRFRGLTRYKDIVNGIVNLSKVWRIDRIGEKLENSTIYGKTTDFTLSSIRDLINRGITDAKFSLLKHKLVFSIEDMVHENSISWEDGLKLANHIAETISLVQNYKPTNEIISKIQDFISLVNEFENDRVPSSNKKILIGYIEEILELIQIHSSSR